MEPSNRRFTSGPGVETFSKLRYTKLATRTAAKMPLYSCELSTLLFHCERLGKPDSIQQPDQSRLYQSTPTTGKCPKRPRLSTPNEPIRTNLPTYITISGMRSYATTVAYVPMCGLINMLPVSAFSPITRSSNPTKPGQTSHTLPSADPFAIVDRLARRKLGIPLLTERKLRHRNIEKRRGLIQPPL